MRRFAALVVLCVFSLQACWAAAAAYCQHENSPRVAHVGHHVHDHAAQRAAPDNGADAAGTLMPDLDCHGCHAPAACVSAELTTLAATPSGAAPPQRISAALPAPPRARVERPNWLHLA